MMLKITGLARSLLSLAKASEKDQKEPRERTEPRDRIPDQELRDLGAGSPTSPGERPRGE